MFLQLTTGFSKLTLRVEPGKFYIMPGGTVHKVTTVSDNILVQETFYNMMDSVYAPM